MRVTFNQKVGFRKTTLVDYPGQVAAAIFFPFCNMRCPWCHNGKLIVGEDGAEDGEELIPLNDVLLQIEKRKHVLGGVVLSGGEPTLYPPLPKLISEIKKLGLAVKLDTNGTTPDVLSQLLLSLETKPDYIACDLKIAPKRYAELCGGAEQKDLAAKLDESAEIIRQSGIEHEFRSLTLDPAFFSNTDIDSLAPLAGNSPWHFRPFRPGACLDEAWNEKSATTDEEHKKYVGYAQGLGKNVL
jgi:pyruvate formate lyase activating enzyme